MKKLLLFLGLLLIGWQGVWGQSDLYVIIDFTKYNELEGYYGKTQLGYYFNYLEGKHYINSTNVELIVDYWLGYNDDPGNDCNGPCGVFTWYCLPSSREKSGNPYDLNLLLNQIDEYEKIVQKEPYEQRYEGCFPFDYYAVLLPRQKSPSGAICYADDIFKQYKDGKNHTIQNLTWQYINKQGKYVDLPNYKNRFPLNVSVEEIFGTNYENYFEGNLKVRYKISTSFSAKILYSNSLTVEIIACSPKITSTTTTNTTCSNSIDGTATFTFEDQLQEGYDMRFYLYDAKERSFFEGNEARLKDPKLKEKGKGNFPDVFKDATVGEFNASKQATLLGLSASIENKGSSQEYFVVYQSIQYEGNNVVVKSGEISKNFTIQSPTPVTTAVTVTQPECSNNTGSVTVTAGGGQNLKKGTYYYSKDNGKNWTTNRTFSGLAQGSTHTFLTKLRFSDGKECVSLQPKEVSINKITNPLKINSFTPTKHPTYQGANNGSVRANVSGNPPFAYEVLNDKNQRVKPIINSTSYTVNIEGLSAGTYKLRVKNNNNKCEEISSSITLAAPPKISIKSTEEKPISCYGKNDASITVTPKDGYSASTSGPTYKYKWFKNEVENPSWKTNKIENLSSGAYKVIVTDDNNDFNNSATSVSQTFTIKEVTAVKITNLTIKNISCYGKQDGSLTVTVSGGTGNYEYNVPYTNKWISAGTSPITIPVLEESYYESISVRDKNGCQTQYTPNEGIAIIEPEVLTVKETSNTHTNNNIYGGTQGTLEVEVSGGTAPYKYSWTKDGVNYTGDTNTLSKLPAGSYQVTITDANGCKVQLQNPIIITEPDKLLILESNIKTTHVKCNGFSTGSISVTAQGGIPPYHYTWEQQGNPDFTSTDSPTLENLSARNYRVTVTDESGSQASHTTPFIEVTQPQAISITSIVTDNLCYSDTQGSIDITVSGGTGSYSFKWNNEAITEDLDELTSGEYTVTVTDANSCEHIETITVGQPDGALVLTIDQHKDITGFGWNDGAIAVTITGGTPPYTYEWFADNGFTSTEEDISKLLPGNYTLVVKDANADAGNSDNCSIIKDFKIVEPDKLTVEQEETFSLLCNGDSDGELSAHVTGGITPYSYTWYQIQKGIAQPIGNSEAVLTKLTAGSYQVKITDANGVEVTSGIHELTEPKVLAITLKSIQDVLCHGASTGSIDIDITGGTKPYDTYWTNGAVNEDISNISAGNYTVTVKDANGCWTDADYEVKNSYQPIKISNTAITHASKYRGEDGAIEVTITGGAKPYVTEWIRLENQQQISKNTSIENLKAGNYQITITDIYGCQLTAAYEITQPDIVEETIVNPTCFEGCDGSISILVNKGDGNFTYTWDTGANTEKITNLCAGKYTVTIEGFEGKTIVRTYEVINPNPLIIDLGEDITTLCVDQQRTLNATIEDPGASYQWSSTNGFTSNNAQVTVDRAGVYTVVVTDSKGCKGTDEVEIKESPREIDAEFFVSSQVFVNERFTIIDVTDPIADRIEWMLPKEAQVVEKDQDMAELYFKVPGSYELTMATYVGDCQSYQTKKILVIAKEESITSPEGTTTERESSYKEFLVYPNPTGGVFTVSVKLKNSSNINLRIFNLINNSVIAHQKGSGSNVYTKEFNISSASPGMYAIVLETPHGNAVRKLILK